MISTKLLQSIIKQYKSAIVYCLKYFVEIKFCIFEDNKIRHLSLKGTVPLRMSFVCSLGIRYVQ